MKVHVSETAGSRRVWIPADLSGSTSDGFPKAFSDLWQTESNKIVPDLTDEIGFRGLPPGDSHSRGRLPAAASMALV